MAKTPTVRVSCVAKTKFLADSNGVSKTKTPRKQFRRRNTNRGYITKGDIIQQHIDTQSV